MSQDTNDIFNIPAENLKKFEAKIAQLNKKAKNLGVEGDIEIMLVGYQEHKSEITGKYARTYEVLVIGPIIQLDGWDFLGRISHDKKAANMVFAVPGKKIPEKYREELSHCDHCFVNRFRRNTFIVQKDGETKQIGSTCIKDFFGGHNPEKIAQLASRIASIGREGGAGGDLVGFSREYNFIPLEEYLAFVVREISEKGWVSRGQAHGEQYSATADVALYRWNRSYNQEPDPSIEELEEAKKAIDWAKNRKADNDYVHNIQTLANEGACQPKDIGFAASIVAGYQRELRKKETEENKIDFSKSKHVGQIKDKIEIEVTILRHIPINGFYGVSTLHKMLDKDGNVLSWFCNGESIEVGKTVKIRGKVKNHDEYRGVKETLVNYVKVVEE